MKALGFFSGVRAAFGGLGFIVTTPSAWGWALIPIVVATALFGGASVLTIWGGSELALRIVGDSAGGSLGTFGVWMLKLLFWAVGLVVAFFVSMSLAQPLSGFALDAIARKQELALGGRKWPDQPLVAGAARSLRVSLTALAIGLPILAALALVTFLVPPAGVVTVPLKFIVTGLLAAYDLLDYPLSQRGLGSGSGSSSCAGTPCRCSGSGSRPPLSSSSPASASCFCPLASPGRPAWCSPMRREPDSRLIHPR